MPNSPFDGKRRGRVPTPASEVFRKAEADRLAGNYARAERGYRAIIKRDKTHADAHALLGLVLAQLGRPVEAQGAMRRAVELAPNSARVLALAGGVLRQVGKPKKASQLMRRAVEIEPRQVQHRIELGSALRQAAEPMKALDGLREAQRLDPRSIAVHIARAQCHADSGDPQAAIACLESAKSIDARNYAIWLTLGNANRDLGMHERAAECFREAVAIQPGAAGAHSNLAVALRELGHTNEAETAIRRAIELAPETAAYRLMLAWTRRHTEWDDDVQWVQQCAKTPARFGASPHEPCFAMARIQEHLGDYDAAFHWLDKGNRAMRAALDYDVEQDAARFRKIREVFDAELLARAPELGSPDTTPVFIVGMARSGTSLVEQMLASHPEVHGAGELEDVRRILEDERFCEGEYPEAFTEPRPDSIRASADEYLRRLRMRAPEARYVTDKMPMNFEHIGAIRLWFPHAKIVHCVRDPRATCTSIYRQMFSGPLPYSWDQRELGRFYRLYEQLMAHWRSVLSDDAMIEVRYEDVVADTTTEARRLCDFLSLDWDERCVRFHETSRVVQTLSWDQVRRPVYDSALSGWQRYEHRLGELLEALDNEPNGGRRPA